MSRSLILLCLLIPLFAQPAMALERLPDSVLPEESGPWVVRVWYSDRASLTRLTSQRAPWAVQHSEGYVVVQIDDRADYQQLLDDGFKVQVDADLSQLLRNPGALRSIPGFACYRTVEETHADLNQLAIDFPNLAQVIDIGDSWEKVQDAGAGYDLLLLKLTNSAIAEPKPRLFIMASMHARELTPAETATRFAEQLLDAYADDADVQWLLNQHELYVIPLANPDGRKFAEGGMLWRKNVNENYCGATSSDRGADLNRNFPFEWGLHNGSSDNVCSGVYRGPNPQSEPETEALIGFLQQIFVDARPSDLVTAAPADTPGLFIDMHSASGLVIWPWGFGTVPAPNGDALASLGRRLAWFNDYVPQQAIDLYVTDGTTTDYAYGELGVAAMAYELGTVFFESCNAFDNRILPDNLASLRYALRVSAAPYQLPSGPQFSELYSTLAESGDAALLLGRAADGRFGGVLGAESVQPIAGGTLHAGQLDQLPLAQFLAADGAYDSADESVYAVIDTVGMPLGRQLLVARSSDQAAQSGPGRGTWLEIVAPGSTGTATGQLTDAATLLPVSGVVLAGGYGTLASTAGYGLRLPPGAYDVSARAPGYLDAVVSGVDVQAGASSNADMALTPICERYSDDAESRVQWQFEGDWGVTTEQAFSPSSAYTDSPGGDYAGNTNTAMVSEPIDLRFMTQVQIEFASRCDTERGFDLGRLEYRIGDGAWTEAYLCTGEPDWQLISVDVPALDGAISAQLRFRLATDTNFHSDGWYVDDIKVSGGSLQCEPWSKFDDGFEDS